MGDVTFYTISRVEQLKNELTVPIGAVKIRNETKLLRVCFRHPCGQHDYLFVGFGVAACESGRHRRAVCQRCQPSLWVRERPRQRQIPEQPARHRPRLFQIVPDRRLCAPREGVFVVRGPHRLSGENSRPQGRPVGGREGRQRRRRSGKGGRPLLPAGRDESGAFGICEKRSFDERKSNREHFEE